MAYTFSVKPIASPSNFGGLAVDGNRVSMTGVIGSGIQTVDATASPVASPMSMSGTTVYTLNVPNNAASIIVHCAAGLSAGIRVSESPTLSSTNLATYTVISNSDGPCQFDVSRQSKIYFQLDAGSPTLAFHFVIV